MRGLDTFRLAQVLVTTSQGSCRYGTAYSVTPNLILTAGHVIHGEAGAPPGVKVEVRFLEDGGPLYEVRECWASAPELDACLLELPEARHLRGTLLWGEYQRTQRLEWESTGFPSAAVERREGKVPRLDTADAHGELGPYGVRQRKQYELLITAGGPSSAEAWKGLSGGPVFAKGCLIGLIRSVPAGFDGQRLYATPVARLLEDAAFKQAVGAPKLHPVPRPFLQDNIAELPGSQNPGALLDARYQVVPFHEETRQKELESLDAWCEESAPLGVRLFTGASGVGKTRLFIQWCKMLRDRGWHAGFLSPLEHGDRDAHLMRLEEFLGGNDPIFITIDEAEVRTSLSRELEHIQAHMEGAPPVRVALLARQEGDWWRWLREQEALGELLTLHEPMPLAPVPEEGPLRKKIFEAARAAFTARLESRLTPTGEPDLSDPRFEHMLFLHMSALIVAVQGRDFSANTLVDQILEQEQRFWCDPARLGNDLEASRYLRAAQRAVAALTLKGGAASREGAERTLAAACAPDGGFLEVLRRLYPGRGREGDHNAYVRGLEPDTMGARLVERVLLEPETGSDYLERIFEGEGEAAVRNGFLVLGGLSLQQETAARSWLKRLLMPDVRGRAKAAFEAAMALGRKSAFGLIGAMLAEELRQQGTPELAKELAPLLPDHTISLREVALWVTEEQLKQLRTGNDETRAERAGLLSGLSHWLSKRKHPPAGNYETRAERARLLGHLGFRLGEVGRQEEALGATQEAVAIWRELARQLPAVFLPDLADLLPNLGNRLSKVGRREESLAATQEAVAIWRELARQRPEAFLPGLAMSLGILGVRLGEVGRREEALAATQEAVATQRELARQRPEAFLSDLATSLNNLGNRLSKVGRREESLAAAQEALAIQRELARQRPEAFLPGLAAGLNNLGIMLGEVGRREEALAATQEAVAIRRELARQHPEAFLPDLATSLNNLCIGLLGVGRKEEALAATQEALEHYRELARQRPASFLPGLATGLNNLGVMLGEVGRREEALAATQEAVEHYREMARQHPEAFLPDLATSLVSLGIGLLGVGRREEALAATQEAVEHYRELARQHPETFLPDLATSLVSMGIRLSEAGRWEEALRAMQEAVEHHRELARQHPEAFLPDLARSLNNLGIWLGEVGRWEKALGATQEAVTIRRELTRQRPATFLPDLASSLDSLGTGLSKVGRLEEALAATQEAVEIQRKLVRQRPTAVLPDLARSLNNLGIMLGEVGRREEALAATQESAEHYRELARQQPATFLPDFAKSLSNLCIRLGEVERWEEAWAVMQEALELRRKLTQQYPEETSPAAPT